MENMVSKVHEAINTVCGANDRRMDHLLDAINECIFGSELFSDICNNIPGMADLMDKDRTDDEEMLMGDIQSEILQAILDGVSDKANISDTQTLDDEECIHDKCEDCPHWSATEGCRYNGEEMGD